MKSSCHSLSLLKPSWIGDTAFDCTCSGGQRRSEQRASSFALPPFEISIAGTNGSLAGRNGVTVHGDAHTASGFAPLRAGFLKHSVEAFGFRLSLHLVRPGNDEHADAWIHLTSSKQSRCVAKIR